jgi:hypothetical protein
MTVQGQVGVIAGAGVKASNTEAILRSVPRLAAVHGSFSKSAAATTSPAFGSVMLCDETHVKATLAVINRHDNERE